MIAVAHNQPQYMISNGVLYVREWEWRSGDDTLLGYAVRTVVRDARLLSTTDRVPPDFHVTFANGWVFTLALAFADTRSPGEFVSDLAFATIYWGDGPIIKDPSSIQTLSFVRPQDFIGMIRDLAGRESLGISAERVRRAEDEDVEMLIALLNRHSDEIMQGRVFTEDSAEAIREMREERDARLASA